MDTLKLIYTDEEAFELVSEYEKPLKERIEELKKENKILKKELDDYSWQIDQIPYVVKYWCSKE